MGISRNRLVTLAVVIAILAVTIWWQSAGDPAPVAPSGTMAPSGGQQSASPRPGVAKAVPVVALTRLSREAPEPSDTGRDPFRFSANGPGSGRAGAGTALPVTSAPRPVASSVESAGPPPPPPIPLKFIGVVSRGAGTKIAMLTDGRGVYYGTEGSVIEGQYRIVRIGQDSIDMTYLDGRGRRTIPLSGS
ncbi:MAG: hypothetical protein NT151_10925 [Acidobacteria bacterium]|nr:hypothetical protein [Acidobacteriota bacterium]